MIKKQAKIYDCSTCYAKFSNEDAQKVCSNCFACTGCDIYICPNCGKEVEKIAMKKPDWKN